MRVLVTFALDAEFAPWRKIRNFEKLPRAGMDCYSANLEGTEIDVLLTGIGGKKAWVEATKVLWDADVDICISSGLAGGLKPEHRLGDILAAESIYASETKTVIPCDLRLLEAAASCGAKVVKRFLSTDHVVLRADEKRDLGSHADLVEMESGEVLSEAAAFGARGIAVRAISDAVDEDLPLDLNRATTESGGLSFGNILGQIARNPSSVASLLRFGRQSRLAAAKLAAFLESYLKKLVLAYDVPLAGGGERV